MKSLKLSCLAIACTLASELTQATTQDATGKFTWSFVSGSAWPTGYDQSTGKPQNMEKITYTQTLINRINAALPESKVNLALLTDDVGSNITLSEEAEVYVNFIHEGAGYLNSFGYFTFNKNSPPTRKEDVREKIIFPNLSFPHMQTGNRVKIGKFPAGTSIGFVIVANGFSAQTGVKSAASPIYYSLKGLNPESTSTLRQHNVLLSNEIDSEIIIGFEDLPRNVGDNDFNDAIIGIETTPEKAIITDNIAKLPAIGDTDGDGVPDNADQFPTDASIASSNYYPSANDWVTLAFEDNWPSKGDFDFNDLVVREKYQTMLNANGKMTGFILSGYIDARGGIYNSGFGLRLLKQQSNLIKSATISVGNSTSSLKLEDKQSNPVFLLWNNSTALTTTGEGGNCVLFNTLKTCGKFDSVPYQLEVKFASSIDPISHSDLDFFIFRSDYRAREVHFADYPPTDKFDKTQFGKFDDTSNESANRYFRTAQNLPWAIKVNTRWRHPREYIDIVWAYPDYEGWVESGGGQHGDWYKTSDRVNHYY